jgi:hypothetical protein
MQKNKDFRKTANVSELLSNFVICKNSICKRKNLKTSSDGIMNG